MVGYSENIYIYIKCKEFLDEIVLLDILELVLN